MKKTMKITGLIMILSACFVPQLMAQEHLENMVEKLKTGKSSAQIVHYGESIRKRKNRNECVFL